MRHDQPDPPDLRVVDPDDTGPPAASRNLEAERAVLGVILIQPGLAEQLRGELDGDDFYLPAHELVWNAIHHVAEHGGTPEPVAVHARLVESGDAAVAGGAPYLHELTAAMPLPAQAAFYARAIRDAARLRAIDNVGLKLRETARLARTGNLDAALEQAVDTIDKAASRFGPSLAPSVSVPTITEFLTETSDQHDWLVPGLLERQDRVILTAGEGAGKSTLGRQFAVMAAAGIHPFNLYDIEPVRVLILDFENSERQLQREIGRLYGRVLRRVDPDRLRVMPKISGVNLLDPDDRAWMRAVVDVTRPDLIVTGPAYKMTDGDTDKEKESKPVALYLDELRSHYGCAVWLEAHVGNETPGSKRRPERPFGWSGWRRWPEFGLYLDDQTGELRHWRGDRDARDWPAVLARGGDWPFTVAFDEVEDRWMRIKNAREKRGEYLSQRDLVEETGIPKSTIVRIIGVNKRHYHDWLRLNGPNPYDPAGQREEERW